VSEQRSLQRFPRSTHKLQDLKELPTDNGRIKCPEKECDAPKTLVTGTNRF